MSARTTTWRVTATVLSLSALAVALASGPWTSWSSAEAAAPVPAVQKLASLATRVPAQPDSAAGKPAELFGAGHTNVFAAKSWYVAPPPPPPPPEEKPKAPPFPFTLLGSVEEDQDIKLFLKRGETNYVVHPGEVFEQGYRLDRITAGTATFTYLPLNEQQKLTIGIIE